MMRRAVDRQWDRFVPQTNAYWVWCLAHHFNNMLAVTAEDENDPMVKELDLFAQRGAVRTLVRMHD
jgi:hypothetical protein